MANKTITDKDTIEEMHEAARKTLEILQDEEISEWGKKVARGCFMRAWWGITPEEALKIGAAK